MGLLVDGKWQDKWYDTKSTGGRFKRSESQFRHWVTADGSAGPKVRVVSRQRAGVITCMCPMRVPGPIAPWSCVP